MREIALDTETTGLDPQQGHRVVEIGCVEMHGRIRTGRRFQAYLNPERAVPPEASRVHGLTDAFLRDKPVFASVVDDFLNFIGDDVLVIHNADFDTRFLDFELGRLGFPPLAKPRIVDTLGMARRMFPGAPASLDALCRRFGVDAGARSFHGALLDAELLAEVYLELLGGRQSTLGLALSTEEARSVTVSGDATRQTLAARHFPPSDAERAAHAAFLGSLKKPLWLTLKENT